MKRAFLVLIILSVTACAGVTAWSFGRRGHWPPPGPPPFAPSDEPMSRPLHGIQWFPTWESGLREAQRTGRPILFVSAAPHCAGVSGMW